MKPNFVNLSFWMIFFITIRVHGNTYPGRTAPRNVIFIMADDPGETTDLKSDHPDMVQELSNAMEEWEESLQGVKTTVAKIK